MMLNRTVLLDDEVSPDAVQWDDSPCPLCGMESPSLVLEAPDAIPSEEPGLWFAVVRCEHCGLMYTNPRPSPKCIGRFYPVDYRPHRRPRKMEASRPARPIWSRLFGRPCNERRGTLPWHGLGRLLDFGCGGGSFLKRMADQGWNVTGLDAAVGAVREIQDELGLNALPGSLPHPDLHSGSFDVVTMWHSLEHVHHPLDILREAYRVLTPGGKLVVATPNIESLPYYWFGQSWFGLDLPRHLTHFTPKSLREMIETAGFVVERTRMLRHADWLRSSAKLAAKQNRDSLFAKLLRFKPVAKAVAWACYAAGMSDCMMVTAHRPE